MKKNLLTIALLIASATISYAGDSINVIKDGGKYFIYNTYYNKVLGTRSDKSGYAGLSTFGTNDSTDYVWTAKKSTTDGYYWLVQENSGKYLQASNATSDTYSVWLTATLNSSYDTFKWLLTTGIDGSVVNKKSSSKYLGVDAGKENTTYVGVFYDKEASERTVWQIINANYPINVSRLSLYTGELQDVLDQAENIVSDQNYDKKSRDSLETYMMSAENTLANATIDSIKSIDSIKTIIKNSISKLTTGLYTLWITGSSFDVGAKFTTALKDVRLANDTTKAQMIIRNTVKSGAIVTIQKDSVKIGNGLLSVNVNNSTGKHDYQFAFDGENVLFYFDNELKGKAPQANIGTYTSVGTDSEWSILGLNTFSSYRPEIISFNSAVAPLIYEKNSHNKAESTALMMVGSQLSLDSAIDYHILGSAPLDASSSISLTNDDAWVIFDNVRPSTIIGSYLKYVKINGATAVNGSNCRVVIYLQGAALVPQDQNNYIAFTGFSGSLYSGEQYEFKKGCSSLSATTPANNMIRSFILKRGYMATLATSADGTGYSRVFVADHEDLLVSELPTALNRRISYINIKKWNYVSKKGWSTTEGISAANTEGALVGATWFYTWSADKTNQYDMEYVPQNAHEYWPSVASIASLTDCTHMLGLNEPEHSEQHTSCSCNENKSGTTSAWNACTETPRYQTTGMRIGSPAPTDASYLTEYFGHIDDMAYRCDFAAYHAYWGSNEASSASVWYSRLKAIYDATGRPIWLTEWNNGATWTTETKPSYSANATKIKAILDVLDNAPFIERYDIYNWDVWQLALLSWDSNKSSWWITPAGQVYRDRRPTFGYNADVQKIPNWWGSSIKTGTSNLSLNSLGWTSETKKANISITNANCDMTDNLTIEYMDTMNIWKTFKNIDQRNLFESSSFSLQMPAETSDLLSIYKDTPKQLTLRLNLTTVKDENTTSSTITVNWPDWIKEDVAVNSITNENNGNEAIYSIDGTKLKSIKKGLNIIKRGNRSVKIMVK